MKWNEKDIAKYEEASEYIDTLLIPLMPVSLSERDRKKLASQSELIQILGNEIERSYHGRIFLFPTFNYIPEQKEDNTAQLNRWVTSALQNPFKHVFFLSFDPFWKKNESDLSGNLIWLPSLQLNDVSSEESKKIIKSQVSQITELIQSYW